MSSKLSKSPFGWGDICIRDFETFICHSCLVKPDMSLIETWPNYYIKDKSYVPVVKLLRLAVVSPVFQV